MPEEFNEGLKRILTDNMQTYEDKVTEIKRLFKRAGYVQLSPDQSLPEAILSTLGLRAVNATVKILQREGWVKVGQKE